MRQAFLAHHAFVNYERGEYIDLLTGQEGIDFWESVNTDVFGCFNVNPSVAQA
jgi:hypothetical protein